MLFPAAIHYCSSTDPSGHTKVVHLLFATLSPGLYLLFSFTVKGFCS